MTRRHFMLTATTTAAAIVGGGMGVQAQPAARAIRKDITRLSAGELQAYRDAFRQLQAQTGMNSYSVLAGYHGCPDYYCHRDSRIFLPWHRAYVLKLEQALQAIDPTVALHYWDWTSREAIRNGIPTLFTEPTYTSGGMTYDNPLRSFTYTCGGSSGRPTRRSPDRPFVLDSLRRQVAGAMRTTSYSSFNRVIESPHGDLHTWVGGSMGRTTYAAYDPIFWSHHSNVDRQWAQWRESANGADPSSAIGRLPLEPFGMTVSDVVDYAALGYEYDDVAPSAAPQVMELAEAGTMSVPAFDLRADCTIGRLVVHGLAAHPEQSFRVYVFINQPNATLEHVTEDNPNFAGFFGIFGGEHAPGHVHTDAAAAADAAPQTVLDLSPALSRLFKADTERADIRLTLLVTDVEGEPVAPSALPVRGISVQK